MKRNKEKPLIARIIKSLRQQKDYPQWALAKVFDVSKSSIKKWEHGICKPNNERLNQIVYWYLCNKLEEIEEVIAILSPEYKAMFFAFLDEWAWKNESPVSQSDQSNSPPEISEL